MRYEALSTHILRFLRLGHASCGHTQSLCTNDLVHLTSIDGQYFQQFCKLLELAGGSVPVDLVGRFQPHKFRRINGAKERVAAAEVGAQQNIQGMIELGVGEWFRYHETDGSWTYRLSEDIRHVIRRHISDADRPRLRNTLFYWACYSLPVYEIGSDVVVVNAGRALAPLVVQLLDAPSIPPFLKDYVLETLISAAHFAPALRKRISRMLLELVDGPSSSPLQVRIVLQHSVTLRVSRDVHASNSIIHRFCCNCRPPHNISDCIKRYFDNHLHSGLEEEFGAALLSLRCSFSENLLLEIKRNDDEDVHIRSRSSTCSGRATRKSVE